MITRMIATWIVLTLAFALAANLVPGFKVKGVANLIVVAAAFGLANVFLGWLITLVLGVATLGIAFFLGFLTRWVVNTILLKVVAGMTDRLEIRGWIPAFQAAAVIGIAGALGRWLLR